MPTYKDLKDKTAVVTGAGSGIGREISIQLSKQGCKVILLDLNEEGLKETQKLAENSEYKICNVTDEENVKEVFNNIQPDIIVNNAGIAPQESYAIEDVPLDLWNKIMNVNVTGYFLITKYAEKHLKKNKGGSFIYICSNAGILGSAENIYGISNSARIGLMKQTALEMAKYNVRSNAIIPGDVLDSGIWDKEYLEQRAHAKGMTVEEVKKYYETRAPLKNKATANQVAQLVLFLASDETSNHTTGQILKCDGGQVMS